MVFAEEEFPDAFFVCGEVGLGDGVGGEVDGWHGGAHFHHGARHVVVGGDEEGVEYFLICGPCGDFGGVFEGGCGGLSDVKAAGGEGCLPFPKGDDVFFRGVFVDAADEEVGGFAGGEEGEAGIDAVCAAGEDDDGVAGFDGFIGLDVERVGGKSRKADEPEEREGQGEG